MCRKIFKKTSSASPSEEQWLLSATILSEVITRNGSSSLMLYPRALEELSVREAARACLKGVVRPLYDAVTSAISAHGV